MRSSHRVIHLSDLHLTATGLDEDGVDGIRSLHLVLDSLRHITTSGPTGHRAPAPR